MGRGAASRPFGTDGAARRRLLDDLARYRARRPMRITVVFDGAGSYSTARKRESYRGVEVIYSKMGETADEVMVAAIREGRAGLLVATSDRAIIDEAKGHGVPFITADRLEAAIASGADGEEEEAEEATRKGNPKRAPKAVRLARRVIRKI